MWCHVLLGMPVFGLGLFFVLPFSVALPLYLVIVLISLLLYYKIMESMNTPVLTGPEALIGQELMTNIDGSVRWQGEWWSTYPVYPGRHVRVVGLRGLQLEVEPAPEHYLDGQP
jgi:membrane protein implicated in regulation of membrane protease activity